MTNIKPAISQATGLLKKYTISDAPIDIEAIASALGVRIRKEPLDEDTSGVLVIRNGRGVIGVNQFHHPNRQRFTVAHELGHFLLHGDGTEIFVDTTYTFYRDNSSSDGIDSKEIEANAFAAELLMPKKILERYLNEHQVDVYDEVQVRKLARMFEVSEQALTIRLVRLGLVNV